MVRHTRPHPEDCYLDLRALSERTCISVRTLRNHMRDVKNPLPCFQIGGKIYVRWCEFVQWTERFRVRRYEDLNEIVDSMVRELQQKER
jgi:hypothetical protein